MTTHTQRAVVPAFRLSPTKLVLWAIMLTGLALAVFRFMYGIGEVSNMSDAYSWGIWISFDLLCGVALAAGAFMTCGAFHILGIKEFRPLVKPAVLTGFLGYLAVIIALLVDLGRPERIWHMLIYQNVHSPLFEVGMCVMAYTTVLFFEFSPMFFDWLGWRKIGHLIHRFTIGFVILGVVLSTLHQSSLGSLFVMMSDKLHPLWHTPLLPVFFFFSAATAGLAMVIFESSIAANAYGHRPAVPVLGKLAKAIPWMAGVYLLMKVGELAYTGELALLVDGSLPALFFWIEMGLWALAIVLFALPAIRRSASGLFLSACLVVGGLMLNRFNVGLLFWNRPAGSSYFPSWMELAVSFGVISALVLTYDFVATRMALFEDEHAAEGGH
ncbi:MAG: NrfD/PsrC family molybdoenzyme membrane anchor subunit [Bacillota bacterium]